MKITWRCFHCGEVFTESRAALEHFGVPGTPVLAACCVDAKYLRQLELELSRYRNEDSDLHRKCHAMQAEHSVALRRAEEVGYAKGLQDGKNLSGVNRISIVRTSIGDDWSRVGISFLNYERPHDSRSAFIDNMSGLRYLRPSGLDPREVQREGDSDS